MELFGIHEKALLLREQRTQILAENIANADTPNYKARDVDFQSILKGEAGLSQNALTKTNAQHLSTNGETGSPALKYRNPMQQSLDGNTVDSQIEQAEFSENAIRYTASLSFINQRMSNVMHALKGD